MRTYNVTYLKLSDLKSFQSEALCRKLFDIAKSF